MWIVANEKLLGYTIGRPSAAGFIKMVVQRVDETKGGDPTLIDRTTLVMDYRKATKEDEERFLIRLGF